MHGFLKNSVLSVTMSLVLVASLILAMVPATASSTVTATAVPSMISIWGLGLLPEPQFDTGPATTKIIVNAPQTATVTVDVASTITAMFPTVAARVALFPQSVQDAYAARMAALSASPFTWDEALNAWTHDLGTEMEITEPSSTIKAVTEKMLFEEAVLGDVTVPVRVQLEGSPSATTYKVTVTVVDMQRPLLPGWNLISTPAALGISKWGSIAALGDGLDYQAAVRWDSGRQMWMTVRPNEGLDPLDAVYVRTNGFDTIGFAFARTTTAPPTRSIYTRSGGWILTGSSIVRGTDASGAASYFEMPASSLLGSINGAYSTVISPGASWTFVETYSYDGNEIGSHDWSFNQDSWVHTAGEASVPQMTVGGGYWVNLSSSTTLSGVSQTPITMAGWNPF